MQEVPLASCSLSKSDKIAVLEDWMQVDEADILQDTAQPTLGEIPQGFHKCIAAVHKARDQLGGLMEEVEMQPGDRSLRWPI